MAAPNIVGAISSIGPVPTRTYTSGSTYQANGGTVITAGLTFSNSFTFTGLLTTDEFGVTSTKAQIDALTALGITVTGVRCTAANTVEVSFIAANAVPAASIPAAASWYCTVLQPVIVGNNLA